MICKNCQNEFTGNYCNQCGQSSRVRRLDFQFLMDQIWDGIFQINRGFFYTAKELTLRPGTTIRHILAGHRVQHFKSLSFLILCATIYVLVNYLLGHDTFLNDFFVGFQSGAEENEKQTSQSEIFEWIGNNQVYSYLILIPIFSIASFVAFYKSGYNYVEHLVINLYIGGIQMLIYFLFSLVVHMHSGLVTLPLLLGFAFNIWSYFQIFQNLSTTRKILLLFLTYFIYAILFTGLFTLVLLFTIEK